MIKFRQKDFTIPEGHYTGPKDIDKVPGVLEMVGKSALGGAGIGAVAGAVIKDSSILSGAFTGAKYGSLAGIFLKFLLNYLHNPMSRVKFQDVDKNIRREFGIYRVQGITVGDSVSKRAGLDEKFSINDREVSKYKINFAIQDDQVTMYTLGMTDKELDKTSEILDYYCKKYFGMEYTSTVINKKVNSYSVVIVFTNYQVISNFMMELSDKLGCKINLMDNKALVDRRITESSSSVLSSLTSSNSDEVEEREFSVKKFNKYDLIKILCTSGVYSLRGLIRGGWSKGISSSIHGLITGSIKGYLKIRQGDSKAAIDKDIMDKLPIKISISKPEDYSNRYLEKALKDLHYVEGYDYTVGEGNCEVNMSLCSGLFILTASKVSDNIEKIDNAVYNKNKTGINRTDSEKVVIYTYPMKSRNEFDYLLKRLMSTKLTPNIFEG